ncbi:hypothetical protein ACFQE8_16760 [Salinirubellus sp. GCM10025818]|jgi:hypothetical protein|uniref:hypothetical protein n=1 Tax=Salinirubellus TaxID=2162630 RepID=UPI0030D41B24
MISDSHVPIEITVADEADERPTVESHTRIDVAVQGEIYPTAELADGRYVAWWFEADEPPEIDSSVTTEWVAAPTRFLAAATLRELWEDPRAFEDLAAGGASGD